MLRVFSACVFRLGSWAGEVSILLGYQEMQKCPLRLRSPFGCLGRNVNTTAIPVIFIAWFVFTLSLKSKFWVNEQR